MESKHKSIFAHTLRGSVVFHSLSVFNETRRVKSTEAISQNEERIRIRKDGAGEGRRLGKGSI